ncbi:hypothetical protein [Rickettsiella endosymbiont of Xylota segnis]|uniref:hypothetical protein n=1 Tax=Rickettsiella endosymbiont of Xylota segnis TaxID=3066238 RepID=UPI0030CA6ACD
MAKDIQTAKNENCQKIQNLNLLVEFKKVEFSNRIKELKKLIKENNLKPFQINPAQLKEFLSLFSEHHKFIALELVKPFLSNTNELKNIELKSTQLVSVLSLFHTVTRCIVLETLIPLFINSELTKLKKFELKAAQLKAILFLFANSDRLKALKLLIENFDIKINLTETDIKELETCLARDSDFKNLLSSDRKKIWNTFFVKNEEHSGIYTIHHKKLVNSINKLNNTTRCHTLFLTGQREKEIYKREVSVTREKRNISFDKLLIKSDKKFLSKFAGNVEHKVNSISQTSFPENTTELFRRNDLPQLNNLSKKTEIKNESLELLSIKINQRLAREKLDFFKKYVNVQNLDIVFENAKEICKFIKLFPPHDAIKFLKLPYIQDQVKNLQQQKAYFTIDAYKELLNYLPENFNKRLLNSISPVTTPKQSSKIFNPNNNHKTMPDLIPKVITRGI